MAKNYKKGTLLVLIIGILAVATTDTQSQSWMAPFTQQKLVNTLLTPSLIEPTTPNETHYKTSMTQFTQDLGLRASFDNLIFTNVWR